MNFTLFSISGILNMFRHGLLHPTEVIKADDAISLKIIFENEKVKCEDHETYENFLEVVKRARNLQLVNSVRQCEQINSDKSQEFIDDFDLTLFDTPSQKLDSPSIPSGAQQLGASVNIQHPSTSTLHEDPQQQSTSRKNQLDMNYAKQRSSCNRQNPQPTTSTSTFYQVPQTSTSRQNQLDFYNAALRSVDQQNPAFKHFSLMSESTKYIKKFNTEARSLTFNFKPVDDDEDTHNPMLWLESAFEELRSYAVRDFEPSDRVGLVLRNPNFADKPIGVSFRRVDQLSTAVLLSVMEKILQSNALFFSKEIMTMQVDRVRLPSGRGRTHLTGVSFEDFCSRKVGILSVPGQNNFCLASAVVLAIAFKNNDPEFHKLKIGLPILNEKTLELCIASNVDLRNGGIYEHIQKIQDYLVDYTIIVYNSRYGKTTYFEGPREPNRITINLLLEDNHYNVITSLTSAFTTGFFCELCKHRFNDKKNHRRCLYTCPACHTSPPCWYMFNRVKCEECQRDFRGEQCLASHKRSGLCKNLFRCSKCFQSVWREVEKKHKCGTKFCSVCQKLQPIRHFCYMQPNKGNKQNSADKSLLIFFDIESRQETVISGTANNFVHEPNLCVAAHVCSKCTENEDIYHNCDSCGKRLNIFKNNPIKSFLNYVSQLAKHFKITVLAHNLKGYDGCFVLKEIIINREKWNPKVISNGTKIISITCNNVRFIDSLNYMPLPLSKLPKTFNFPESKGYFPYLFNTLEHENHIGTLPDMHYYAMNEMHSGERERFLEWYSGEVNKKTIFDMKREIVKYCIMDVQILLKACLRFWKIFRDENNVDCFREATTIASACNLVFRRRFLKKDTISIIPPGGYRLADKQSVIAIQWLLWMEHSSNISIQHSGKAREFRTPAGILVDGYCETNNTVYEFLGCFWHGCEECFPNQLPSCDDDKEEKANAMFLRREYTEARAERIKSHGYKLKQEKECRFRRFLKTNEEARLYVKNHDVLKHEPLNPRDSFFGGRTNAVKLHYKCADNEKIQYYDIVSLYPYVNKYGKYPIGHPEIHIGHDACSRLSIDTVEGLIKCLILPPSSLLHPVLPYRLHNKLMFILCRTCAETLNQSACIHSDEERSFVGTFVADELRKALSLNYSILEYHEIWEYEVMQYDKNTQTGGLFSGYVNNFLRLKQECSGWPASCITDADKEKYINDYFLKEGILLRKEKICKNPGMRFLAKLMLNSFWGKFGQRENLIQTSIITNPEEFFKLLTNPVVDVHSITPIDDEVILVNWNRQNDSVKPLKTVNVVIAAYTTANARLELYKYLENLNERVLYFDTDSVFFYHREGQWIPESGEFLGQMKNELEEYGAGSYVTEFVSGGPKNYSYSIYSTNTKSNINICKVKGITLNYKNSEIINFEKMREIVCENNNRILYINTDRKIVRTCSYDVISRPEKKMYRINYNKRRRVGGSFDTLPYGFRD